MPLPALDCLRCSPVNPCKVRTSACAHRCREKAEDNANARECPHEDVRLYLDDPARAGKLQSCQQVDGDHGRIETRRATVCHEVAWLQECHDWPGLAAIGKIDARRETERNTAPKTSP